MESALDPTSVAPNRLEEARRRTAVVAEFTKLERPTRALAEAYAARLGIGLRFFYMLVQIYREHGTVVKPRKTLKPSATSPISPAVDAEIETVIAELGADAPLATVDAAVKERCRGKGLPVPSWSAVRTRVRRERRLGTGSDAFPDLVLDRTALAFNVRMPDGPKAAWLTVLLHAPSAKVLAFQMSVGSAGPVEATATLLQAIGRKGEFSLPLGDTAPAIAMYRTHDERWRVLAQALNDAGLAVVGPVAANVRSGAAITRLLGDRIGRIALRPRLAPGGASPKGGEGSDYSVVLGAVTAGLKDRLDVRVPAVDPKRRALAAQLKRMVR